MSKSYEKLKARFSKIYRLSHLGKIAQWDQAAMMPSGGNQARGEALAELNTLLHQLLTGKEMGEWLERAKSDCKDDETLFSLREMKRTWQQASIIPDELVKAKTLASNHCEHAWRSQRTENDWSGFAKNLNEVIKQVREEAQIRAEHNQSTPYDAMVDLYEPGMTSNKIDQLFGDLASWLPTFVHEALELQKSENIIKPEQSFPEENQKALGLEVMKLLGFDFNHGRVDISTHPFCGGTCEDVRITTRYKNSDFVEALMSTIHETGHARYNQNLPEHNRELPVAGYRSMGIHESQSLLFEMQLGRSPAFLTLLQPLIEKHLCGGQSAPFAQLDNLEKIYTQVRPGFIRVEADEITYPAHIILRYEIERDLVNGDIEVADIPQLWNQKMLDYLGVEVGDDYARGCMQDIHWPMGAFGYFPSYTLGAMYAAQLFATIRSKLTDVDEMIRQAQLNPIFDWLNENIWSKGSYYSTDILIRMATGEPLNSKHFKTHLQQRYLGQ